MSHRLDFIGKDGFVPVKVVLLILFQSLRFVAVHVVWLANLTATVVVATDSVVDDKVRKGISAHVAAKFSHVIVRHQELIVIQVHRFCCAMNVKVSDLGSSQAKPFQLPRSSETHRCYRGRPVQSE
jgi:hypothetical protein